MEPIDLITTPGVYQMSGRRYHQDPVRGGSMSNSAAKALLENPRKFRYWQINGRPEKDHYDFGHGAHKDVLGKGEDVVVVDERDWKKREAQAAKREAHAAGKVPLLIGQWETAQAMAKHLRADEMAGQWFTPGTFEPEQVLVWWDEEFGMWRRAMVDAISSIPGPNGELVLIDYKTCAKASPDAISKAAYDFGYFLQDPFYSGGAQTLELDQGRGVIFKFAFQEKDPPYCTTMAELTPDFRQWGRLSIRKAMEIYQRCLETDHWPSYPTTSQTIAVDPPRWAEYKLQDAWDSRLLQVEEV